MKPYVFLLLKLNYEGKPVVHSSWIGHKQLPTEVVQHKTPIHHMKQELHRHGYKLQRLA